MNATAKTITRIETAENTLDATSATVIITMAGAAGIIGLWALVSLAVAMVANGPLGLIRSWVSAVVGM